MGEKLAIELRRSSALEPAGRSLWAPQARQESAKASGRSHDQISISESARAIADSRPAAHLEKLAAAVASGSYRVPAVILSRSLLSGHLA